MKGADLPGSAAAAMPSANGTHRARKKNGAAPKRSGGSRARGDARSGGAAAQQVPEMPVAPFLTGEPEPIDAPMWPLHSALWCQPELAPSVPAWSGLDIERHNRIPAPDFQYSGPRPINRPDTPDNAREVPTPVARPEVPQSGLAPLGWDPRADCRQAAGRKEERE